MSLTVLVDYDSGNLHSARKAFERMALELGQGSVVVTSEPDVVARADRIVLPGDGAFPSCRAALTRYETIAAGPLASDALSADLARIVGRDSLAFYDAIAPIVVAESLDFDAVFQQSRYDDGPGDYLNCPMDREQYEHFISELLAAKSVPLKRFEETHWFESCLPIEEIARRGPETLRFGPMKPKGLSVKRLNTLR